MLPIFPRGIRTAARYGGTTRMLPRSLASGSLKVDRTVDQAFTYRRLGACVAMQRAVTERAMTPRGLQNLHRSNEASTQQAPVEAHARITCGAYVNQSHWQTHTRCSNPATESLHLPRNTQHSNAAHRHARTGLREQSMNASRTRARTAASSSTKRRPSQLIIPA